MKIDIKCKTKEVLTIDEVTPFVDSIKVVNIIDEKRLEDSIKNNGFLFPVFIWEEGKKIIDGNTRIKVLKKMLSNGYEIDGIPTIFVRAKDEKEAKEKVLQVNSRYGKITEASLNFFAKDARISLPELNIPIEQIKFEKRELPSVSTAIKKLDNIVQSSSGYSFGSELGTAPESNSTPSDSVSLQSGIPSFADEEEDSNYDTWAKHLEEPTEQEKLEEQKNAIETIETSNKRIPFSCVSCYCDFTLSVEEVIALTRD